MLLFVGGELVELLRDAFGLRCGECPNGMLWVVVADGREYQFVGVGELAAGQLVGSCLGGLGPQVSCGVVAGGQDGVKGVQELGGAFDRDESCTDQLSFEGR